MKIYKRSIYEDQGYAISFGTEEDLNDVETRRKRLDRTRAFSS